MEINEYGDVLLSSDEVFTGLYNGSIDNLGGIILLDLDEVEQFNNAILTTYLPITPLLKYTPPAQTVQEHDALLQSQWFMPTSYVDMDIAAWVSNQCKTSEEEVRVTYELSLFDAHELTLLLKYLKYLVDTMREHNLVWGVGRGSACASYVLYLIGVHKINSIKYSLDIHEFLR